MTNTPTGAQPTGAQRPARDGSRHPLRMLGLLALTVAIEVEDGEADVSWVADEGAEFVTGSGVADYELDGLSASGSATFVNQWEPGSEPVAGTFEVRCER